MEFLEIKKKLWSDKFTSYLFRRTDTTKDKIGKLEKIAIKWSELKQGIKHQRFGNSWDYIKQLNKYVIGVLEGRSGNKYLKK